jgi:AcrR family transcriptional regulator
MSISYQDLAHGRNTKHGEKLDFILRKAASIMAEEGYHRATIRKVARALGGSISSLYYYFKSKEELLFHIQHHTFRTLLEGLAEKTAGLDDPQERTRAFIRNHLDHFFRHMDELKVCSHELSTLSGRYYDDVLALRRAYFKAALEIVKDLLGDAGNRALDPRLTTLNLFGMLDWIYTWYRPQSGLSQRRVANQITNLFLNGIQGER